MDYVGRTKPGRCNEITIAATSIQVISQSAAWFIVVQNEPEGEMAPGKPIQNLRVGINEIDVENCGLACFSNVCD